MDVLCDLSDMAYEAAVAALLESLRAVGYSNPRIKQLGAEHIAWVVQVDEDLRDGAGVPRLWRVVKKSGLGCFDFMVPSSLVYTCQIRGPRQSPQQAIKPRRSML